MDAWPSLARLCCAFSYPAAATDYWNRFLGECWETGIIWEYVTIHMKYVSTQSILKQSLLAQTNTWTLYPEMVTPKNNRGVSVELGM